MNISNFQRIKKVIKNLISNPDLIPLYVKHNVLSKRLPMDLGIPWWSYRGVQYVDSIVDGKKIFEYGTGGSTLRYAKKAKQIMAVEDDKKWCEIVNSKLKKNNINNVTVQYSPFDFENPIGFENSDYLKKIDSDQFEIVIIDGQDHSFNERIKCFHYVEPRMKQGQYIVVDDFWRYEEELLASNHAKEVKVFESVGPRRFGVTSTAVFVY